MKLNDQMFVVTQSGERHTQIRLNPGHYIYQAHFPGNPITPGVCIIQIIGEILGLQQGCTLALEKIVNMKFVAPLSPVETPLADILFDAITPDDGVLRTKGSIQADGKIFTKFSLVFRTAA